MIVWIDALAADRAGALFGLAPLERHLRGLGRLPWRPRSIVVSGRGPEDPDMPARPEVRAQAETGPAGRRLRRCLAESDGEPVLAIDGGSLVDPRLVASLADGRSSLAARGGAGAERAAALRLDPADADLVPEEAETVLDIADRLLAERRVPELDLEHLPGFIANLRRSLPPYLFAMPDRESRQRRERWLFRSNYKGSTDFLTKWVYPPIVWQLTRLCTRFGIHPNWVTVLSILLAFAAVPFFAAGSFWAGLGLAYAMSILDSVDGKVARLTLTDSPLGNVLDHGLDIVHPPVWYLAWAWGLGARSLDEPLMQAAAWLVGFYVADRLVLMVAKARFKRGLHAMTPLDAAVRTIIARRNVTLAIFTLGIITDLAEPAFYLVVAWQGLTAAWHAGRTVWLAAAPPPESGLEVVPVDSPADLERFIRLPFDLHRGDPHWVPPLLMERRSALSAKSNPFFGHAEVAFWIARRDGRDVGRISAQIDRNALAAGQDATGHFGLIAAIDDPRVFAALTATAEAFLRARGMRHVLGPFNLSINEEMGLLVEGFEAPPMLLMGHDRSYVGPRLEDLGYRKAKDVFAYLHDIEVELPRAVRWLLKRPLPDGLTVRPLRMADYDREVEALMEVFNDAWAGNWGFVPLTETEIRHLAREMRPLIRERLVWFAELDRVPAAFLVCLPNINEAIGDLDGRLLPFGWAKLLWRLKVKGIKTARVPLMGVRRQYAGGFLGSVLPFLLIDAVRRAGLDMGFRQVELSWILEDNLAMRNIIEASGGRIYKTYRIYGKPLA